MGHGDAWSREGGSPGISGEAGGWLVTLLSLLRRELRPLKAGVMEAEKKKNPARRGTGATVQIRRSEVNGGSRGRGKGWRGGRRGCGGGFTHSPGAFSWGP